MKNIANNFKKYKFVYLFLLLSLIIVLSFRQTLSFLTDEKSTKELKTISSNLEVLFEHRSNTVNLASALPMSDSEGMSQVGYTFDVKNAGDVVLKYRVLLELDSSITNQLDNNKIKYSYNINNGPYSEIKKLDDSLIIIKENTVNYETGSNIDTINIKFWIDYNVNTSDSGKIFRAQIVVDGIQNNADFSEIKE